jgi:hypothetical protein
MDIKQLNYYAGHWMNLLYFGSRELFFKNGLIGPPPVHETTTRLCRRIL